MSIRGLSGGRDAHSRVGRVSGAALLGSFLLLIWIAPPANSRERSEANLRGGSTNLRVELREAKLSADVRERPWAEFLIELTRTTGVRIHLEPFPTGLVSTSFRDLPIARALRHVFGPAADFVYRYDSPSVTLSSVPLEVWIFRRDSINSPTSHAGTPGAAPAPPAPENGQTRRADIRAAVEQHLWVSTPVLIEALRNSDPDVRKEAAVALALFRDDVVVDDLETLLWHEQDPEMRATVAEILATIASPHALVAVRAALADADPNVRTRAVAALVNSGGEAGLAFLREAARAGSDEARHVMRAISQDRKKEQEVP